MNIQQLKFLAKLALFFFIIVIASVHGYLTWLISTSASILLADLLSVLLHRYSPYISRLYHFFHLENPRRKRRHSDILAPLVALFVAPLFSHKLFDDINVTCCMVVATTFYPPMMHYFGRPRNFRVLNVLFMLSVNISYGEFGFGPNTCASVAFFTYIAVLAGQAEAGAAYEDDLHHLTLNQIMSNLMIELLSTIAFHDELDIAILVYHGHMMIMDIWKLNTVSFSSIAIYVIAAIFVVYWRREHGRRGWLLPIYSCNRDEDQNR